MASLLLLLLHVEHRMAAGGRAEADGGTGFLHEAPDGKRGAG
jgi:hypothetical protein